MTKSFPVGTKFELHSKKWRMVAFDSRGTVFAKRVNPYAYEKVRLMRFTRFTAAEMEEAKIVDEGA